MSNVTHPETPKTTEIPEAPELSRLSYEVLRELYPKMNVVMLPRTPNAYGINKTYPEKPSFLFMATNDGKPESWLFTQLLRHFLYEDSAAALRHVNGFDRNRVLTIDPEPNTPKDELMELSELNALAVRIANLTNIDVLKPTAHCKFLLGNYHYSRNGNPIFSLTRPENAKHILLSMPGWAVDPYNMRNIQGLTNYQVHDYGYFVIPIGGRFESPYEMALLDATLLWLPNFRVVCTVPPGRPDEKARPGVLRQVPPVPLVTFKPPLLGAVFHVPERTQSPHYQNML